ncbi:hypothetical protein QL996_13355 [Planococcus sp. APC 4015]|nr:hypothetical protein [Planococcus sp. APC 4015]
MRSFKAKSEFLAWFLVWGGGIILAVGFVGVIALFTSPAAWLPILLFGAFVEYVGVNAVRAVNRAKQDV